MTTSCVCALDASLNWVSLRTRLGSIWASATGATETFSSSDLRSTVLGALEKRWRPCSSRKNTSKDVRCTPTRFAAAFFSLAVCPDLLLRRRTHWGSESGPCFRKLRDTMEKSYRREADGDGSNAARSPCHHFVSAENAAIGQMPLISCRLCWMILG